MKQAIRELIDQNWTCSHQRAQYLEFDLHAPHCEDAHHYRDVQGGDRWRCRHDPITDDYRDRASGGLAALAR